MSAGERLTTVYARARPIDRCASACARVRALPLLCLRSSVRSSAECELLSTFVGLRVHARACSCARVCVPYLSCACAPAWGPRPSASSWVNSCVQPLPGRGRTAWASRRCPRRCCSSSAGPAHARTRGHSRPADIEDSGNQLNSTTSKLRKHSNPPSQKWKLPRRWHSVFASRIRHKKRQGALMCIN